MSNKSKIELLLLIALLFLGANYGIYSYYLKPNYEKALNEKNRYLDKKRYLDKLNSDKSNLVNLKKEAETLKIESSKLNDLIIKQLDTPQIVYDFYNACLKYKISGKSLKFELNNNSKDKSTNLKENFKDVSLVKLSIYLKIDGEKNNIENFIRNLNSITGIHLSVKNVSLKSNAYIIDNKNVNIPIEENSQISKDNISADIIFYQYLLLDGTEYNNLKKYDFFNGADGFNSISDMIKKPIHS